MATKNKQPLFQQNSNNETGISLCIPFVFKTVSNEKIFAVIRSMKVGHIERIDIVNVSGRQNKAFIHFAKGKWAYNENARNILNDMKAGIPWIVPYCRTGFWKIGISTAEKPTQSSYFLSLLWIGGLNSARLRARLMARANSRCFFDETAVILLGTIFPRSETNRCSSLTSLKSIFGASGEEKGQLFCRRKKGLRPLLICLLLQFYSLLALQRRCLLPPSWLLEQPPSWLLEQHQV